MHSRIRIAKGSIARQVILKLGGIIAGIILAMITISYFYTVSTLEKQTLDQLEKYVVERGQREESLFVLAEDNHAVLKKEMLNSLKALGSNDTDFERY